MSNLRWQGSFISEADFTPSTVNSSGIFDLSSQQIYKNAGEWRGPYLSGLTYSYWTHGNYTIPTTQSGFDALFSGTPVGTGLHTDSIIWDSGTSYGPKPSYLPADYYSWQVEGFIFIPTAGTYAFGIGSDDGNQLTVNGTIVAYHYGGRGISGSPNGTPADTGSINLSAGYNTFRYRMQEAGGGDGGYVGWQQPGDSGFSTVPATAFFTSN